jgi:hypothetical protein
MPPLQATVGKGVVLPVALRFNVENPSVSTSIAGRNRMLFLSAVVNGRQLLTSSPDRDTLATTLATRFPHSVFGSPP